jgi:carboxymethylenebutenolidase
MEYAHSQSNHSCCNEISATDKFAAFGKDAGFVASHPDPIPVHLTDLKGNMITFKCKDGADANGYEIKSDKPTNKYILMFHEWYGLNDYIKSEADALQSELGDVNVLAVDLYDGKVAANSEEAGKYVQTVKTERAVNIINGSIDYTGSNLMGSIGWCFGGGWSLQSALLMADKCKACVMYYGMPESDKEKLSKLSAPVLGIFGLQDGYITPAVVAKFQDNMKELNKSLQVKSYDAVHGFANPSNPKHDEAATKDSWSLTINFFKDNLK